MSLIACRVVTVADAAAVAAYFAVLLASGLKLRQFIRRG